jgi:GH15 family glucan-1,4-alpha-glucosidase
MKTTFKPISSYGFIGNLGSCALVNLDGSIDWCCLPYLSSPSVFGSLLDPEKGGSFSIRPIEPLKQVRQFYLPNTNILRTEFTTAGGRLELTDWFHMGTFSHEEEEHHRLPAFYRHVRCVQGSVTVAVLFDPQLDYARSTTIIVLAKGGIVASGADHVVRLHTRCRFRCGARGAWTRMCLDAGQEQTFLCTYGLFEGKHLPEAPESLRQTIAYWDTWVRDCQDAECPYLGRWHGEALRSSLVLKVLSGGHGIAAAATTSLPEILGGQENWDYRFSWIRDTSFTIQALTAMGHTQDAREFLGWLCATLCVDQPHPQRHPSEISVLYPLRGDLLSPEEELMHLCGYQRSRPVRIGNAAALQRQHDIYGELLETVFRSERLHPTAGHRLTNVLQRIVDYVCDIWQLPDDGIWELRSGSAHYVYSKVMCWVAIDRGIRLAQEHAWNVDLVRWERERNAIHAAILEEGYSEKRHSFVQAFGSERIDATALLFPLLEFLPPDHPRVQSTLATIRRELCDGPFVYRSDIHHGKEGAFGFCSFWLVDALAVAGRIEEATENFLTLLKAANHLGLYAEEIDPKTRTFLGNFPQAFTHVGLINSALYLGRATTEQPSAQPLMGEVHMPGGQA